MRRICVFTLLLLFAVVMLFSTNYDLMAKERQSKKNKYGNDNLNVVDRPLWVPNRIADYITNNGQFVSSIPTGSAGLEWPVGSHNTTHFAGGIWLAGMKRGEIVTAAGEFTVEFQPGKILADGTAANSQDPQYKVYVINNTDPTNPLGNPDYMNWPVEDGAPVDEDGNPLIIGSSTAWAVMNDLNPALHNNLFSTKVMGVEVQMLAWAFDRPDAFGDMLFFKYTFINKSGEDITGAYVGVWNDIDVGDAQDLVGSDTTLSLGYMYKTQADGLYGANPPAIGTDFFQGPIVPSPGDIANVSGAEIPDFRNLPMTSFAKYINSGPPQYSDPNTGPEAYNFMQGLDKFGAPIVDETTGQTTLFWHPGDPVAGTGWLDNSHADKRYLMNSGPFTLADGDQQEVVFGLIIAQGNDGIQSVELLKRADEVAQLAYDINFALPPSPENPEVTVATRERSIFLSWDRSQLDYRADDLVDLDDDGNPTEYTLQGYNVYQLDSPVITSGTTIRKIASFDIVDGVTEIRDSELVPELGQVVELVVQDAQDTGLQHHLTINADAINGNAPLIQNRKYYFAVTAYGYNPFGIPKTLESSINIITVRPQFPDLGSDFSTGSGLGALTVSHASGFSDGEVRATVVNQEELVSGDYSVTFRTDENGGVVWDVSRGGTVELAGWSNQGSDPLDFPIVNGMLVETFGPPVAINFINNSVAPEDADDPLPGLPAGPGGDRWVSGVNWTGSTGIFFGGIGLAGTFLASTTVGPTDYFLMDINFTSNPTMSEETGWSRCIVMRRDLGYVVEAELGWAPMQAFDMTDPANPRRVNIAFVEDANAGLADGIWNPIAAEEAQGATSLGGREYTFFMASDYDGATAGGYDDSNPPYAADALYALWPQSRSRPYQLADFVLRIVPNFVNGPNDVFTFSATAPTRGDQNLARSQAADRVNVYPNPYGGFNIEETDPLSRFLTFTNLPEDNAKIQIFNLAGELVRTLEHSGSSYAQWNLRNETGVPVASGLYLARIDMGDLGTKVLKLAIMAPQERLDVF